MRDALSRLWASLGVTRSPNDAVQATLAHQQQRLGRIARFAAGNVEITSQLPFSQAIKVLDLLLLHQCRTVFGGPRWASMHTRRRFATLPRANGTTILVDQRS